MGLQNKLNLVLPSHSSFIGKGFRDPTLYNAHYYYTIVFYLPGWPQWPPSLLYETGSASKFLLPQTIGEGGRVHRIVWYIWIVFRHLCSRL